MKKQLFLYAIAIAIAGLLIASAAGLPTQTKSTKVNKTVNLKTATQEKISMQKVVNIGTTKAVQNLDKQTMLMKSEDTAIEAKSLVKKSGLRQDYFYATQPALAEDSNGQFVLGHKYENETFLGAFWQGSLDYGTTWGPGIYWIYANGQPIPFTYPAVDYWGVSPVFGQNEWFGTMVWPNNNALNPPGTNVSIVRVLGDPTLNTSYTMRTWTGFASQHFHDMTMADIACSDGLYFPINQSQDPWGMSTYIISNEYTPTTPVVQGPHILIPIEYNGQNNYGLMSWFTSADGCSGTYCTVDRVTHGAFGIWDPVVSNQGVILTYFANNINLAYNYPNQPGLLDGGWTHYLEDPTLSLKYPAIAANNGAVVAATELHNSSDPNNIALVFWYDQTFNGDVGENFTIGEIWEVTGGGQIRYPKIMSIEGNEFMCTVVIDNQLCMSYTTNGGVNWSDFYILSGDDVVIPEYKTGDLSEKALMAIWEYENGDNIELHYTQNYVPAPIDITSWHAHAKDKNKGLKGTTPQYTYSTILLVTGSPLYYNFSWGDGTSTMVGPVDPGVTATASHAWAQYGIYDISVTVTDAPGNPESLPLAHRQVRMYKVGDTSGNDIVGFDDINPFVLMLSSGKNAYYTSFPNGYYYTGDINRDTLVDFGDINPFVALLSGGGCK